MPGDRRYFNVEFNPNRLLYLGIGTGIPDLIRLYPLENNEFAAFSTKNDTGWNIEYGVPHAFIRRLFPSYTASSGTRIRGNFNKCGDLTQNPHYLAWNPVNEEGHTFHSPDDFGELIFE